MDQFAITEDTTSVLTESRQPLNEEIDSYLKGSLIIWNKREYRKKVYEKNHLLVFKSEDFNGQSEVYKQVGPMALEFWSDKKLWYSGRIFHTWQNW